MGGAFRLRRIEKIKTRKKHQSEKIYAEVFFYAESGGGVWRKIM